MMSFCRPARIAAMALALALPALGAATQAIAQDAPAVVLFEDPALSADRLHYPVMIAGGRGYRILCASQADEESVIHGLGFTTVSTIMSAVDPAIVAAAPGDNPKLCPTGPTYTIKVFAGPRDDPFFIDLEAAFCILPDRKPSTGALSQPCALTATPSAPFFFRMPGINYVAGFNVLSIVVELPSSQLENGAPGRLGIWGTISR